MDHGIQRRLCHNFLSLDISSSSFGMLPPQPTNLNRLLQINYAFEFRTFRPPAPAVKSITLQQFIQTKFYSVQPEQHGKGIKNNEQ